MDPNRQEALSTLHARDTFRLRQLSSGAWAIWDQTHTLIAIVPTLTEVPAATEHLRLLTSAERTNAEAVRLSLLRRAEEQKALDSLELDFEL